MAQLSSMNRNERTRSSSNERESWSLPTVEGLNTSSSANFIDGNIDKPRYLILNNLINKFQLNSDSFN